MAAPASPFDAPSVEQQKLVHSSLKAVIGGNILPPIASRFPHHGPEDVLDIGCGTGGVWITEIAAQYSSAQAVGLDIRPRNQSLVALGNCSFVVGDATEELPFHDENFDVVQIRDCTTIRDRSTLYTETHRVLKEGGMLQLVELSRLMYPSNGINASILQIEPLLCKLITPEYTGSQESWALDPIDAYALRSARTDEGPFWKDVVDAYVVLPVGEWPTDLTQQTVGANMATYLIQLWRDLRDIMLQKNIVDEMTFDKIENDLQAAINEREEIKLVYSCLMATKHMSV